MADVVRIWIETAHNLALRCGGWAYVAAVGGALMGAAGGERTASAERMALAGLIEALKTAPGGASVEVTSAGPLVLGLAGRLAAFAAGEEPPADNLDLWAPLTVGLKQRTARFVSAASAPGTPTAFAAAWAELARDKAKASGGFRAVIPKANLAKLRV